MDPVKLSKIYRYICFIFTETAPLSSGLLNLLGGSLSFLTHKHIGNFHIRQWENKSCKNRTGGIGVLKGSPFL